MNVICISGKAQHGKDTSANLLREELEAQGKSVLVAHYADLLKYLCRSFFHWNGEKDDTGRRLLQYVGTDIVRKKRPDFWVGFLVDVLTLFPDEWDYVLIPDCRFPNEIEAMRNAGFDVTHLRIVRPNFESPLSEEQQKHPSETALDGYPADRTILNNGTIQDLRAKLSEWLYWFGGGE